MILGGGDAQDRAPIDIYGWLEDHDNTVELISDCRTRRLRSAGISPFEWPYALQAGDPKKVKWLA